MKKLFLMFTASALLAMSMTSCESGEDRLSEEELNARVDSIYLIESAKLTEEMTLQCNQRLEAEVMTRAEGLVTEATMNQQAGTTTTPDASTTDVPVTDEVVTTDEAITDDDTDEEISDEEIIRQRVDEKLAHLRTELEQNCEQQLIARSRAVADSLLTARGSTATLPAKKKTGTTTGKNTETTTNDKQKKMEGGSNVEEKKEKMEGGGNVEEKKKKMEGGGK